MPMRTRYVRLWTCRARTALPTQRKAARENRRGERGSASSNPAAGDESDGKNARPSPRRLRWTPARGRRGWLAFVRLENADQPRMCWRVALRSGGRLGRRRRGHCAIGDVRGGEKRVRSCYEGGRELGSRPVPAGTGE